MTTESTSDDSSSIYLIAGRMDTQSRILAKKLHKLSYIYALYGALDGLSLSYSMFKYLFDLYLANTDISSSDAMHDWMSTPEGMAAAFSSSLTLIAFSMLANYYKDEDPNAFKSFIATVWPYCRDTMKGLKNGYKGFRSTVQIFDLLGGPNCNFLIVPVAVLLGGLSAINRVWFRYYVNQRKDMMKANAQLLDDIKNESLSLEKIAEKREKINSQSMVLRRAMFLSAAYGGIVDGLYLYIGVLTLCTLTPAALTAMTVFCAIYFLACIATRIYEEHDYQRKLVISQATIELALCGKELEANFIALNQLAEDLAKLNASPEATVLQLELTAQINRLREQFEGKRTYLRNLSTLSFPSAVLAGMKNGLAAYGALTSALFGAATIMVLTSASFPPALLISCVTMGMVFLIGFTIYSIIKAQGHQLKQEAIIKEPEEKLNQLLKALKEHKAQVQALQPEEIKGAITKGMIVDPSPQFFFQEWFEVVRSFFSGLGKGSKAVDFTMNTQDHDSPIMFGFTVVMSLIHALTLALRAYARGFGRDPLDKVPLVAAKTSKGEVCTTTSTPGESDLCDNSTSASLVFPNTPPSLPVGFPSKKNTAPRPYSCSNLTTFFKPAGMSRSTEMSRSKSEGDLSILGTGKHVCPPPEKPSSQAFDDSLFAWG